MPEDLLLHRGRWRVLLRHQRQPAADLDGVRVLLACGHVLGELDPGHDRLQGRLIVIDGRAQPPVRQVLTGVLASAAVRAAGAASLKQLGHGPASSSIDALQSTFLGL
eukprot:11171444-Lingulodinium_polyedra.AAC.1